MFIHPEMRHAFFIEKRRLAHNKPGLTYDAVCEMTRTKLWAESLADTNAFLKTIIDCPIPWTASEVWDDRETDEVFEQEMDEILDDAEDL